MSTYTKYNIDARENLSRIRHPGDYASDGICEQRVIFSNPNNIYYGIFAGRVSSDSQTFNSCDINGGTINGATLDNVTIKEGESTIYLADLTSNVSELSGNVDDILTAKIPDLQNQILSTATSEAMSQISSSLHNQITASTSAMLSTIDDVSSYLSSNDSKLCSQILALDEEISSLSDAIDGISTYLSVGIRSDIGFLSSSISTNRSNLNALSGEFLYHVDENIEQFSELCSNMLSNIAQSKHYSIVGYDGQLTSTYPYKVKDFAVNIIKDTIKDVKIVANEGADNQTTIGYGYYLDDSRSRMNIALFNLSKTALRNYLPDEISLSVVKDIPQSIPDTSCNIKWSDNSLTLSRVGSVYAKAYDESVPHITVDMIKPDALTPSNAILSGVLYLNQQLNTDPDVSWYNMFIQNIGYVIPFGPGTSVLSNECMIQRNNNGTFIFAAGVKDTSSFMIMDQVLSTTFGLVLSNDARYDSSGSISAIDVTGISLSSFVPAEKQYEPSVSLGAQTSSYIGSDLYMKFEENESKKVAFSVISATKYYDYSLKENGTVYGTITPDVSNEDITSKNFDQLSVTINAPQLSNIWNTSYVLSANEDHTAWKYISCASDTSNSLSIILSVNGYSNTTLSLSGCSYGIGGITYSAKYDIGVAEKKLNEELSKEEFVVSSDYSEITYSHPYYSFDNTRYVKDGEVTDEPAATVNCDVISSGEPSTLEVELPLVEDGLQYSREFIVAANIASRSSDTMAFKIISEDREVPVFMDGGAGANAPTNRWVSLQVNEVAPNKFLVHDLDNTRQLCGISYLSDTLSTEIEERKLSDEYMLSNIADIWKNMRGGLNFMGVLTATAYCDSLSTFLCSNFLSLYNLAPSAAANVKVRQGFFYPIHIDDVSSHYTIEGLKLTHGDWLIAKDNFIVSAATSSDMTVFDAQDTDNVQLDGNNTFTGINTFKLSTMFEDYVEANCISTGSLSIDSGKLIYDGISSLKDLSNDAYSKIKQNVDDIQSISTIVDTKTYLGNVDISETTTTLSAWFTELNGVDGETLLHRGAFAMSKGTAVELDDGGSKKFVGINDYLVVNTDVQVSDIKWNNIDFIYDARNEALKLSNDLSTLSGELNQTSSYLNDRIDEAALSIDGLSTEVSVLSYQCMHYRGDLSGGDGTLSGLLEHTYGYLPIRTIQAGSMHRVNDLSAEVPDAYGNVVKLYKNDYIIFKHDVPDISKVTLSDFNIIRDAEAEGIALSTQMVANDAVLSNAIDNKVYIDALSVESISAQHISQSDFYQDVATSNILSNTLYIVSSNYINAYGEQLKNLAEPELSDDAATKNYVDSNDEHLSTSIDKKIFIDEISAKTLNAIHISQNDFYQKVEDEQILSNELYVVSSNYINAYGEQLKNLASPTDLSDATTKQYVDDISSSLGSQIQKLSDDLSNEISSLDDKVISNDACLSIAIDKKIFIDEISAETLSAIHISQNDFYQKVEDEQILSNELYIVSSNYINAYGEQLKNLAEPTDLSDATTKGYVDNAYSSISGQLSGLISSMYDDLEHVATDSIISSISQKSAISNVICAVVGIRDTLVDLRQTLSTMLGL